MRETIIETPEVTVDIELAHGLPFAHVEVRKWSKDLYKEYVEIAAALYNKLHEHNIPVLNVLVPLNDRKVQKFASMFGYAPTMGPLVDSSGKTYIIMSVNTDGSSSSSDYDRPDGRQHSGGGQGRSGTKEGSSGQSPSAESPAPDSRSADSPRESQG